MVDIPKRRKNKWATFFMVFGCILLLPVTLVFFFFKGLYKIGVLGWSILSLELSTLAVLIWEICWARASFTAPLINWSFFTHIATWIYLLVLGLLFIIQCTVVTIKIIRKKDIQIIRGN